MANKRSVVFIVLSFIAFYLCYRLAKPFLPPLVWGLTLAVLFIPMHRWLTAKLRFSGLAASVSVATAIVLVCGPIFALIYTFISQITLRLDAMLAQVESGAWRMPDFRFFGQPFDVAVTLSKISKKLSDATPDFAISSIFLATGIILIFYFLFYFLRDNAKAIDFLRQLSPLSKKETDYLFERILETIHATIFGTFAMAAVQGTLGGLMFWFLGLPAPFLWGVVMGMLAIVPILGAFIIWIPAAFYLMSIGQWGDALILVLWGLIVVGTVDNLIFPMIMSSRLRMHTVLEFIALVGGLLVFGSSGIVLGPVILTTAKVLLDLWRKSPRKLDGFA